MKNLSDTDLIIEYQSGNKKAFPFLVERWHVQFCKLANWYVKDATISKDIAQESWAVILKKLDDLKEPDKFKSWAISIVNRKAIDWLRSSKRRKHNIDKYKNEHVFENIEQTEKDDRSKMNDLLKKEIAKLSDNQKTIITLFYLEDYSLKEISEFLKISCGTVKSRLFHAREKLKKTLKNRNNEK